MQTWTPLVEVLLDESPTATRMRALKTPDDVRPLTLQQERWRLAICVSVFLLLVVAAIMLCEFIARRH
jgi:hypothetical protein